jgi:hypothetical protein
VSLRKKSQLLFHPLDIFKTDPDGSVLWRGAVRQKPSWRPKCVFNHSRYLPPASILSSTNTRGTALVSCCRMFIYLLVFEGCCCNPPRSRGKIYDSCPFLVSIPHVCRGALRP